MRRLFACAAVLFAAGFATAEDVKLDTFKLTPKFKDAPAELVGHNEGESKLFMYVNATAVAEVEVKADGVYQFSIELSGDRGEKDLPKVRIALGGKDVEKEFPLTQAEAKVYTFKGELKKGKNKVEIEFLNDQYKENDYDSNLYVHGVKFEPAKADEKKPVEKKDK
jgi:Ca-dependent carbohydrate-binding module xylan-binding